MTEYKKKLLEEQEDRFVNRWLIIITISVMVIAWYLMINGEGQLF